MEGMVEEKGILPERSEWFRSSGIIGTAHGQGVYVEAGCTTCFYDPYVQEANILSLFQTISKAESPLSFLETKRSAGAYKSYYRHR